MLEGESKGHLPGNVAPQDTRWCVCLGPGPVLAELGPLLDHLGRGVNGPQGIQVSEVADVAELLRPAAGAGRLILAGDGFPEEDIGFVRRFLALNPAWELVVLGRDAGTRVARSLLGLGRVRWLNHPPDLDQLRDLARAPDSTEGAGGAPASLRPRTAPPPPVEPPAAETRAAPARPATLGDYLGPLADVVQRVDLSLGLARAGAASESFQAPAEDVGDLRQMTRMMKRVAAPPPMGGEVFDVGELFEERLASAAIQSPRELRFLPKGERGHRVRADRAALSEALSSLLVLARGCAAPDGVVRAPYEAQGGDAVRLALEFPEGPLAGADARELLRPGGLADRVPGLGAADLPAALAVVQSQGGDLHLERVPGGLLRAELRLPLAPPAAPPAGPWATGNSA